MICLSAKDTRVRLGLNSANSSSGKAESRWFLVLVLSEIICLNTGPGVRVPIAGWQTEGVACDWPQRPPQQPPAPCSLGAGWLILRTCHTEDLRSRWLA